jgi:hypothetical protein
MFPKPFRAASSTFIAFVTIGFVPLAAFMYEWIVEGGLSRPFFWSSVLTAIAFFVVGAVKGVSSSMEPCDRDLKRCLWEEPLPGSLTWWESPSDPSLESILRPYRLPFQT